MKEKWLQWKKSTISVQKDAKMQNAKMQMP